jgi:hypothetical protein
LEDKDVISIGNLKKFFPSNSRDFLYPITQCICALMFLLYLLYIAQENELGFWNIEIIGFAYTNEQ